MIIRNKGIETTTYYLPPFELRDGELVVVFLYGGAHYKPLKETLADIFTGKISHPAVEIFQPLTFVAPVKEPAFRQIFYPMTVSKYLAKKVTNKSNSTAKTDAIPFITPNAKIKSLDTAESKLLSLYCTLSGSANIVFDLDGVDPQAATEIYKVVKGYTRSGGAAILIDWSDDMKKDCTKFVAIEWIK